MTKVLLLGDACPGDPAAAPPYGAAVLEDLGFGLVNPRRTANGLVGKLRDVVEHRSGLLVEDTVKGAFMRADIVLAVLDNNAALPLRLRKAHLPPYRGRRLAVLLCWAAEDLKHEGEAERTKHVELLNAADVIFVLSRNQVDALARQGVDPGKVHPVPFGVDTTYFTPPDAALRREGIVAVGVDRGRDYATLGAAVRGTGLSIDLFCSKRNLSGLDLPTEITWRGTVPRAEYREVIQRASAVVVPTRELAYPTGQSVALEGAASGACVVTTSTVPMLEYFEPDVTALMSDAGDVVGLRTNLLRLKDAALRSRIAGEGLVRTRSKFTPQAMWAAIAQKLDS